MARDLQAARNETQKIPGQADLFRRKGGARYADESRDEAGAEALRRSRGVGVNSVTLVGRLTDDPVLRRSEAGMAKTSMRVVTNDRTEPEFHDVVAWARTAEVCAENLIKGRLIYVIGRLHTYEYESRVGKRRTTEIIADNVQFLERREAA
jgi:single-strand DNA-binding protein